MRGIKIKRLSNYNYRSDGYYFVTIVCAHRQNLFQGKEAIVQEIFNETVAAISGVFIDTIVVMPNHVHVIFVLSNSVLHLGEIVRRCKSKVRYNLSKQTFLWQPNYYEHIIRSERALRKIREYIIQNPEKERLKLEQNL